MRYIDNFLNRITMYRLTLYYLIFLILVAVLFAAMGKMYFSALDLLISTAFLIAACYGANRLFSYMFSVPTNVESVYITALILSLIIPPSYTVLEAYRFMLAASVIAMGSKFLLVYRRKHIFNPAAVAMVTSFYILNQGASWWVGHAWMFLPVLLGGWLVVRKTQREAMVGTFIGISVIGLGLYASQSGLNYFLILNVYIVLSSLLFFAFIMLTEPQTSPTTRKWQMVYAVIVAVLLWPQLQSGNFYFTPELALLVGNVFAFAVGMKRRLILTLREKNMLSSNVADLIFEKPADFSFNPGQYLEWTLPHTKSDTRGNRRYFTIASSPTEQNIRIGIKMYDQPSSYKKALVELKPGDRIAAGQLAGDFVLPRDPNLKFVFMAGGIGITPFRSMLRYLIDTNQRRDIVIIYSNKNPGEVAYREALEEAKAKLGIQTVYVYSEQERLNAQMIAKFVPDYQNRIFYISGSRQVVDAFSAMVKSLNVSRNHIKTDFFPGFV